MVAGFFMAQTNILGLDGIRVLPLFTRLENTRKRTKRRADHWLTSVALSLDTSIELTRSKTMAVG